MNWKEIYETLKKIRSLKRGKPLDLKKLSNLIFNYLHKELGFSEEQVNSIYLETKFFKVIEVLYYSNHKELAIAEFKSLEKSRITPEVLLSWLLMMRNYHKLKRPDFSGIVKELDRLGIATTEGDYAGEAGKFIRDKIVKHPDTAYIQLYESYLTISAYLGYKLPHLSEFGFVKIQQVAEELEDMPPVPIGEIPELTRLVKALEHTTVLSKKRGKKNKKV